MAYDLDLAERIRDHLAAEADLTEKAMFGGLAFLLGGHMAVAVSGQGGLLVRVDPEASPALQQEPGVEPMVMRGRPMAGWLRVDDAQVRADAELAAWVDRGVAFVRTLPPKTRR